MARLSNRLGRQVASMSKQIAPEYVVEALHKLRAHCIKPFQTGSSQLPHCRKASERAQFQAPERRFPPYSICLQGILLGLVTNGLISIRFHLLLLFVSHL